MGWRSGLQPISSLELERQEMNKTIKLPTVRGVRGVVPLHQKKAVQIFAWKVERGARHNYRRLGKRLMWVFHSQRNCT
jgi:hypothetical protein